MTELKDIADELTRRQRMNVRYHDGELTVPIDGEDILISEDSEHDRILVWAEVVRGAERNALIAAEISLRYNERFSVQRAVTLGVSPEADFVILGRSLDLVDLDTVRLLSEARSFRAELVAARTYFQQDFAKSRDEAVSDSSNFGERTENYLKV
jgi:hypothetical protein